MQKSPLQLEGYFLKEVSFSMTEEIAEKPTELKNSENIAVGVTVTVDSIDEAERRWRCELSLDLKPNDKSEPAYSFHLVLVGFFFVVKEYPAKGVEMLARTNCPAVLYSTAREMLVTVVRRSPFAPVLIPSVTFLEVKEEQTKGKKSSLAKKKPVQKGKTRK